MDEQEAYKAKRIRGFTYRVRERTRTKSRRVFPINARCGMWLRGLKIW